MSIADHLQTLQAGIGPKGATLVAVSKTKPASAIEEAYATGHRHFGENKVQELVDKEAQLPKDICWHMIGHLQRNKVKYIVPFVHLIHGVDSVRLLREINKQGAKIDRQVSVLLQVHIAKEESKFGFSEEELLELLQEDTLSQLPHVLIKGLMGMATNTANEAVVRSEFAGLRQLYTQIKQVEGIANLQPEVLSMGMSGDYEIALAEGSTMVRIGSAIFGARNYTPQS